ncbi:hypothetical protein JCM17961_18760 [Endothiovibrio diazotrophicus]
MAMLAKARKPKLERIMMANQVFMDAILGARRGDANVRERPLRIDDRALTLRLQGGEGEVRRLAQGIDRDQVSG